MAIEILPLTPQQVEAVRQQILDIYRAAFVLPPYSRKESDFQGFVQALSRHVQRAGFRCYIAREETDGHVLGFVYGYTSLPGQWWYDTVTTALSRHAIAIWFEDAFELAELAVLPEVHGQGIGGRLHDAILQGIPHSTAVLSTYQAETSAMHLYRKRGWVTLLEDFYFLGHKDPMTIMGLDLSERSSVTESSK